MLKSFCLLTIETIRAIEVLGQGDEVLKVNLWGVYWLRGGRYPARLSAWDVPKILVNTRRNYQPQLVSLVSLPDFWSIKSMDCMTVGQRQKDMSLHQLLLKS